MQSAIYDLGNRQSNTTFAETIRRMGKVGQSAFPVNGVDVHDIPAQAISGRVPENANSGHTFSGYFNLREGLIEIHCAEEFGFHLRINLNLVPHFAAQPGGSLYAQAHESFTSHGGGESGDPEGKGERKRERENEAVDECL